MAGIIVHVVAFGKLPELDSSGRPKAFYSKRVHDSCYRRPYFDAGLFVESFDDENAKKGYCLYKVGCKGPSTYNTCGNMKWNGGISYPIQSGHGCLGCSAPNFWDAADSFYSRDLNILGGKVEESSDAIGKIALGGVVAGAAIHAVASNISKRKDLNRRIREGEEGEKKIAKDQI
jgi:hydrogenase small subunit